MGLYIQQQIVFNIDVHSHLVINEYLFWILVAIEVEVVGTEKEVQSWSCTTGEIHGREIGDGF